MDIITYPFSWLLLNLYEFTKNYGLSIILFALAVKIVLLPFQMKSKRSMMRTSRLSPLLKELEKKHEGNKQKYQEEVARLYREEKINPMSGCLWSLIPFPILIALYSVIRQPLTKLMGLTAEQVEQIVVRLTELTNYVRPEKMDAYHEIRLADLIHQNFEKFQDISDKLVNLDFHFLGMNLGNQPDWRFFSHVDWSDTASWLPALGLFLIPLISGGLSFLSSKISMAGNPQMPEQQGSMKSMLYMMPLVSVYIGFVMPAALGIYWIAQSVFAIIQDVILNKHFNKILDAEDAERKVRMRTREAELEKKRLETEKLREQGATERNRNTSKKKLQVTQKTQNEERLAAERAEEKERRRAQLGITDKAPASQIGNRKYARGRAYVPDRFTNPEAAEEATRTAAERSALDGDDFSGQMDSEIISAEAEAPKDEGEN